jgi:hypothetical protein
VKSKSVEVRGLLTLCLIWSVRPDIAAPSPLTFIAGPFVDASAFRKANFGPPASASRP